MLSKSYTVVTTWGRRSNGLLEGLKTKLHYFKNEKIFKNKLNKINQQ